MQELIVRYLEELKAMGCSHHTMKMYAYHLKKFECFCQERGIDFRSVNGKESRAFRGWLISQGLAPKTINTIISAVKAFYDFLLEEGEVKGNPITRKLRVVEERKLPGFLIPEQEEALLEHFKKLPRHVDLAFRTMLATGLRVSEVAALKSADIFQQKGRVFLRIRQGKGKKERIVPVTDPETARELWELKQEKKESVFGVSDATLKWHAWRIKKETGIDFHTHRLRHTLATKLLARGVGIDVVQEVLGHENINTTRIYAKTALQKVFDLAAPAGEDAGEIVVFQTR